jgi:hypothetical protein
MRTAWSLLALSALAAAQDQAAPRRCCDKSRVAPWKEYETSGIEWVTPVGAARRQALREDKPILLIRLAGDMSQEGI